MIIFKILFCLILGSVALFGKEIAITNDFTLTTTAYAQLTIEDANHSLTATDILENRFQNATNQTKTSYSQSAFWTKSVITNLSDKHQRLIIRNLRAGIDMIDIYIYKDKTLLKQKFLGDLREQNAREILATKSTFSLELDPNETVTLITRYQSLGSMDLVWEILSVMQYTKLNTTENIYYGIFGGIMIALIIYNLALFVGLRERFFLYYALQGLCMMWFLYATNGVIYFLETNIDLLFLTASTWFAPILMMIFSLLFVKNFLDLHRTNRFLNFGFYSFIFIGIIYLFIFIYGYLFNESLFITVTPSYITLSLVGYSLIVIASFVGVIKKIEGSLFIFIGELIYIISLVYISSILNAQIESSHQSYFLLPLGAIFEMLFFAFAIGVKIKSIKKRLEASQLISLNDQHFIKYGKLVGNIAHLWRQPLSFLAAEIAYLQTLKSMDQEEKIKDEFLKNLPKINYSIELINKSIKSFVDFYDVDPAKESLDPKQELKNLLLIYEYKIISLHLSVHIESQGEIAFKTEKLGFLQIYVTIFEMLFSEFEKCKLEKPLVHITIDHQKNDLKIIFVTNLCISDSSYFGHDWIMLQTIAKNRLHGNILFETFDGGSQFIFSLETL